MMINAYAALERGGALQPFSYDPGELGEHQVEIDVVYCGICHSDLSMINNDWGMSASMDVAGFGVDATVYSKSTEDHAKNGLFYSIAASTSLNGFVGC